MPEQGVSRAQRLFAVVDGWVRGLRIRGVDLEIGAPVRLLPLRVSAAVRPLPLAMEASVAEAAPLAAMVGVGDALREFRQPILAEARLQQLQAAVAAADLGWVTALDVHPVACRLVAVVRDGSPGRAGDVTRYEVRVRDLPFRDLTASARHLPLAVPAPVGEGTAAVLGLTVRRASWQLDYLEQSQQLAFWKAAVRQTGRTARQLRLVGVYPAVPIGMADGLRIDSRSAELLFQAVAGTGRAPARLQDVAVFQDLLEDRSVIVIP